MNYGDPMTSTTVPDDGPDGDDSGGSNRPEIDEQKKRARARAKADRADIDIDHQAYCETLDLFLQRSVADGRWIVVYLAMGDEVNLASLVQAHDSPETRFAVTRTPDDSLALTVHPWGEPQEQHPFGYSQPRLDSRQLRDEEIGAVLVPGLAFDSAGRRLGRGKGYYDRFLARLQSDCLLIGITGDYRPESVPVGDYDVSMTHLAYSDEVVAVVVAGGAV